MKRLIPLLLGTVLFSSHVWAAETLNFAVGLYQPNKELNDKTYQPLADYLAKKTGRQVKLTTVDTWEGIAKSLANGETDMALMGPWGYVLANNEAEANAIATIEYNGKPEYYAIIITHPKSGIETLKDLKGKNFAFGDKGSTSGYLIPYYHFTKNGIEPETYFKRVVHTKHQAIETQVTRGELDAGADYNRNRDAMIDSGLIKAEDSKIIWTSDPLPNDAFGVSQNIYKNKELVKKLQLALSSVGEELKKNPDLLPKNYTGFQIKDDSFYKPIKDAGLATGKLKRKKDS